MTTGLTGETPAPGQGSDRAFARQEARFRAASAFSGDDYAIPPENSDGRARALTVMSPIRPGWSLFVRAVLWPLQRRRKLSEPLFRLSFIHFASWSIVRRIPYNGPPQARERLHYSYNLFETNFNNDWPQYIDAFAKALTFRMKLLWSSSFGFPGPLPTEPFKAYIRQNEFITSYYWSAYPRATVTMVLAALDLQVRLVDFERRTRFLTPEEFKAAYERLITDAQAHL